MSQSLEVIGLRKRFGGFSVINDLGISVAHGERRLILGPNGAGKTTLFNLICGELEADEGSVRLLGKDVTGLGVAKRARSGLARTYQIITLFPNDSLLNNVALALLGRSNRRLRFWDDFAGRSILKDKAQALLKRIGLASLSDLPIHHCAYGVKRRVEIALALAQDPTILLLDEPFAGLSQEERTSVRDLIEGIPRDVSIIMIEHDMDVALSFADTITVLHHGSVIVTGDRAEVVAHPRTREIYLGS